MTSPARASSRPVSALSLLLLLSLTSDPARASPAAPVTVTWPDLVRLIDRHPRLTAAGLEVEAARRSVRAAGAAPNPTLEGTVGHGVARTGGVQRPEWSLSLTVPLGWIAQRRPRIEAAAAEVAVRSAEQRILRRELLVQLGALFWELVHDQARVGTLEALEAQTAALVRTVKRRVEAKDLRPVEAIRVEIELEKVGAELASARAALASRRAVLALWIGAPVDRILVAGADLRTLPRVPDRATAVSRALGDAPALDAARARERALAAEVRGERRARVPALAVALFASGELDRHAWGVGLSIELPLWNRNAGRIAQAERRLAASRRQTSAATLELATAIVTAQVSCRGSVAAAIRYRDGVVPRAEAAAATLERTYVLGDTSLLEAIDARRTLLEARRLHLAALAQAQSDCLKLDLLTGGDRR